ncbi:ThuA domain-containing protein [Saccharopolyspora gloriosae]|uniref:ThuA domain-containing protein n=1 Tax=Saccharopolyspora gloriosae TaxID=455344 RepID=UPI0037C5A3C0
MNAGKKRGLGLSLALLAAAAPAAPAWADHDDSDEASVLVFSKTAGFRHDSIESGIAAIERLGREDGFAVESTEDSSAFTDDALARYDAVVWLSTTGDVLDPAQEAAFERYIRGGGGFFGVHAAADTEYDWPFYGELVGAYFASHPEVQPATVRVEDHEHDSTAHLPSDWPRTDEWYNFATNPRGDTHVLAVLDESSYDPGEGAMGDHPIAWCRTVDAGRAYYTGGGHTAESFTEPNFLRHLLGGIRTAAGQTPC